MNERIKEIADQCYHRYSEHNIDLEKFAQMIVKECIYKVSDLMDHTEYDYTDVYANEVELKALRRARAAIQQHFGVE